ncbi:hypothetical protein ACPDXS_002785 [Vibrio cholerae]
MYDDWESGILDVTDINGKKHRIEYGSISSFQQYSKTGFTKMEVGKNKAAIGWCNGSSQNVIYLKLKGSDEIIKIPRSATNDGPILDLILSKPLQRNPDQSVLD